MTDFLVIAIYGIAALLIIATLADMYKKNPRAFAGAIFFGKLIYKQISKLVKQARTPKFKVNKTWDSTQTPNADNVHEYTEDWKP